MLFEIEDCKDTKEAGDSKDGGGLRITSVINPDAHTPSVTPSIHNRGMQFFN